MTQRQLADALSMSQSAIASYESGRRDPDPELLERLAAFFQVSADFLLGRTHTRFVAGDMSTDVQLILQGAESLPPEDRKFILDYIDVKSKQLSQERNKDKQ
jgi:transcriptional regulator with XRE-family HTH domain